jgi:hypothetical protein
MQFHLWHILVITTSIAVMLATIRGMLQLTNPMPIVVLLAIFSFPYCCGILFTVLLIACLRHELHASQRHLLGQVMTTAVAHLAMAVLIIWVAVWMAEQYLVQ